MTSPQNNTPASPTGIRPPRVLIATGRQWISGARLALALRDFGCEVNLLSPKDHPARLTGAIAQWTPFRQMRPFQSMERALDLGDPDALILADEIVLHFAYLLAGKEDRYGRRMRALIDNTGAGIEAINISRTRFGLLHQASQLQIRIPNTEPVPAPEDLARISERLGFPLVLKSDGSAGGQGVRVARSLDDAHDAWAKLHAAPTLPRVVKRGIIDKEWMHVRNWMRGLTSGVSAQQWISGKEVTSMAMAYRGKMLASVEFEVAQAIENRGPSSVLRITEDPRLLDSMSRIIEHLGINGFCGFDFMCEPETGTPLLIEMNTRPTQISYLPLGPGRDLVAAYARHVLGLQHVQDRPAATDNPLIALFPQELRRDSNSKWIKEAWMDVPWDSPPLIKFALHNGKEKLSRDLLPQRNPTAGRGTEHSI